LRQELGFAADAGVDGVRRNLCRLGDLGHRGAPVSFTCVRAAATQMRDQGDGGRIVCVGSPTGQVGNFGQTPGSEYFT
jgi:NAD(P)-dependent dehydrogenase (short-subunit alcohol dehydrogenase family)